MYFSAVSYVGPKPSKHTQILLCQYLEATIGLFFTTRQPNNIHHKDDGDDSSDSVIPQGAFNSINTKNDNHNSTPLSPTFLTGTAPLCLVSTHFTSPHSSLAIREAKSYASRLSYTDAHLGELWSSGDNDCASLIIQSSATTQLLEQNPEKRLSVLTSSHSFNEREWTEMIANDDPLSHAVDPRKVVELLKPIQPSL